MTIEFPRMKHPLSPASTTDSPSASVPRSSTDGMPNLAYTIAFDPPGHGGTRQMVKMLAASMARTYFEGDLVIFRNSPQPIFLVQRQGIEEIYIETPGLAGQELANLAMAWKPKAREFLPVERYGKVLFLDADSICLRNVDHLLTGEDWDIRYQPETGRSVADDVFNGYLPAVKGSTGLTLRDGINSGTWAVRADCYRAVMEEWERIMARKMTVESIWREQGAWNRLLFNALSGEKGKAWRCQMFEAHEVQFPLHLDKEWHRYRDAAILHCMGGRTVEKLEFMYGVFMQKFFFDEKMTF
jgi:hypothetical protein